MSDISGVAADSAPVSETPVDVPNPINTEDQGHPKDAKPEGKPEKVEKTEAKPLSAREALLKAKDTVEKNAKVAEKADTKEIKSEAKPDKAADKSSDKGAEVKSEVKRDETGKFAPKSDEKAPVDAKAKPADQAKPSYTAGEPPARFTADAKAVWAALPENVRGEVSRMERELTQGYEKHKAAAERDSTLNEFHEMAKQSGKALPDVVRSYVAMENKLRTDLVGGLEDICSRVGVSLKDVAAHVMGRTPDQNASQSDATIRELKQTISQLQQEVGGVKQVFHQQREQSTLQEVTAFAEKNPRFEELSGDIAFFMKSGRAKDLSEAYTLAERLNPPPAGSDAKPVASSAPIVDLSVQTEKGQKSIKGAPDAGSDPVRRPASTSIKESLRRAMAQAG